MTNQRHPFAHVHQIVGSFVRSSAYLVLGHTVNAETDSEIRGLSTFVRPSPKKLVYDSEKVSRGCNVDPGPWLRFLQPQDWDEPDGKRLCG